MTASLEEADFSASLGCLYSSELDELATQLRCIVGLHTSEHEVILASTREAIRGVLHERLCRLLTLELHAARLKGRLSAKETGEQWAQFIDLSSKPSFWNGLAPAYPTLLARVNRIVRNRCAASLQFAERWAADRASLAMLCDGDPGRLQRLSFGAGDSHRRGQTVAVLHCEGAPLVYKPRSVAVDAALLAFIEALATLHHEPLTIRVPRVVGRADYGWAEFVPHRYAADEGELAGFYRGLGHWLAILRVLGGTDLHAENLIAHGASPVAIDCETLFTPKLQFPSSGLGEAADRATATTVSSVLGIGMLPGRGVALGWRGADMSAAGALPGQQPLLRVPGILNAGTGEVRIGTKWVEAPTAQNHPSPQPMLSVQWPAVLAGFDEMTATLQGSDRDGTLERQLERFLDCRIRVVLRGTEAYAELMRMLWHPVSLHEEKPARDRARQLMARMATNVVSAPDDPAVIEAEIEDLLEGDIPFFSTLAGDGQLEGPRGTHWLPHTNLVEASLQHWREADMALEHRIIQGTLVSAYLNDGWTPGGVSLWSSPPRRGDIDARRRRQAARIMESIASNAIRGDDGSITWIAPVNLVGSGWAIRPLALDVYSGLSGIALVTAAYLEESRAGRADPVEGLEPLLAAILHSLDLAEAKWESQQQDTIKVRPLPAGGYLGVGSLIWTHLAMAGTGMDRGKGLARACAFAEAVLEVDDASEINDLLTGTPGAIPALLMLAQRSGNPRHLEIACTLGDRLCDTATREGNRAWWVNEERWPNGIGGFAHGVTGIGWALAKLARATDRARYRDTAQAAFAFDDALFDEGEQGWRDLRMLPDGPPTAAAWCHGAVGIGLARVDVDPHLEDPATLPLLRRAAASTWRRGLGWNHAACHGDASALELLNTAIRYGVAPSALTSEELLEGWLTSLEDHGPACGMTRDVFSPGLISGVGGIAYQLLKAHPESRLPSILLMGAPSNTPIRS